MLGRRHRAIRKADPENLPLPASLRPPRGSRSAAALRVACGLRPELRSP